MDRKSVKVDQQTLRELSKALAKFRDRHFKNRFGSGMDCLGMAITGLSLASEMHFQNRTTLLEVTAPSKEDSIPELAVLKQTFEDGLLTEEDFWNQVASLAMAKLGIVEVPEPEHFTELDLDDCLDHSELHAHQQRLSLIQKRNDVELMCKCGVNPATEPHPCPYKSDVNNDPDTLCTCCEDCQKQCADDI